MYQNRRSSDNKYLTITKEKWYLYNNFVTTFSLINILCFYVLSMLFWFFVSMPILFYKFIVVLKVISNNTPHHLIAKGLTYETYQVKQTLDYLPPKPFKETIITVRTKIPLTKSKLIYAQFIVQGKNQLYLF